MFGAYPPEGHPYPPEVDEYRTQKEGLVDVVSQPFWSTEALASLAQTLTWFQKVYTDKVNGNVQVAGQMASPYAYLVRALRFTPMHGYIATTTFPSATDSVVTQIGDILYGSYITIQIGSKTYGEFPTWMIPAGGGMWTDSAVTLSGAAAATTNLWQTVSNGEPRADNLYVLSKPLFIGPMQTFQVTLHTASGGLTFTNPNSMNLQFCFDGELFRPVQ